MKNRSYNLTPDEFYAIERRARADRAREIARWFSLLIEKIASLFHASHSGDRKAAGHA